MNYIKRTVAFACVAMLGLGLFSCKKCTTCTAKDSDGDTLNAGTEFCGKKSEVEDYETAYKATWGLLGATVTCTE